MPQRKPRVVRLVHLWFLVQPVLVVVSLVSLTTRNAGLLHGVMGALIAWLIVTEIVQDPHGLF